MGFSIETVLDVLSPLSGPRLSPITLALLAYAVAPKPVGDALWQIRHGRSNVHGSPITRRQGFQDLLKALVDAVKSKTWLKVWTIISLSRFINRVLTRLVIDRSPARKIHWPRHIVVITGGGRGLGGRICSVLKDKGATVVVIDRAEKSEHGREDLFISADVTSEQSLLDARALVRKELGFPTMLVSAAGIARHAFVLDPPSLFPSAYSTKLHNVNLDGTFNFVRVFGQDFLPDYDEEQEATLFTSGKLGNKQLRKEGSQARNNFGGHVLLIGSGAAFVPLPGNANYNSSKAGVVSLHHTLSWELDVWHKSNNIRNSVFCPLMIDSAMTEGRMKAQKNQFLFPTLTLDEAANKAIDVLEKDRSQLFFLPRAAYILSILVPLSPAWLFRLFGKATGAHETFVEYTGKHRHAILEH